MFDNDETLFTYLTCKLNLLTIQMEIKKEDRYDEDDGRPNPIQNNESQLGIGKQTSGD